MGKLPVLIVSSFMLALGAHGQTKTQPINGGTGQDSSHDWMCKGDPGGGDAPCSAAATQRKLPVQ